MSKGGLITILGFLLALMPFLGIPLAVKTVLTVLFGALVMFLGVLVREERRLMMRALRGDTATDAYTESSVPGGSAHAHEYAKETENSI